jgi:hypothetical protein
MRLLVGHAPTADTPNVGAAARETSVGGLRVSKSSGVFVSLDIMADE